MHHGEQALIEESRRYLTSEYLPKIKACLEELSSEDIWWRPHLHANSVGHLLLHLEGNLRQWIIAGLGGTPDARRRDEEFAPEHQREGPLLLEKLSRTVAEADGVLARLDPRLLRAHHRIQGRHVSGLQALYHAIEHFSMHTGQIIYVTKLRAGTDLHFYEIEDGIARARWSRRVRE